MEEAQELCNHIAIMDHGRVIASGTHEELVRLVGQQTRIDLTLNVEAGRVLEAWQAVEGVSRVSTENGRVTVLVEDSNLVLPRLFEAATRLPSHRR
jgi:ABC-2 type transport system ATP-binding protein